MGPQHLIFVCLFSFGAGKVDIEVTKCCKDDEILDSKTIGCIKGGIVFKIIKY